MLKLVVTTVMIGLLSSVSARAADQEIDFTQVLKDPDGVPFKDDRGCAKITVPADHDACLAQAPGLTLGEVSAMVLAADPKNQLSPEDKFENMKLGSFVRHNAHAKLPPEDLVKIRAAIGIMAPPFVYAAWPLLGYVGRK